MTELICPKKDLPSVAAELYRALKRKPCSCNREWTTKGYEVIKECSGCSALARYEAIVEAT